MNTLFPKNQSGAERMLRVILGVVLLYFAAAGHAWGWLGIIPLVTGAIGSCPIYRALGISTCRTC